VYMTIPEFFSRTLTRFPDRIAIRNTREKPQEPQEVTYRELDQMVSKLSVGLANMGIGKRDKVAIMSRPRIRFAASLLAIARLGGWVIPVDPTLTVTEVADILDRSGAKAICAPEMSSLSDSRRRVASASTSTTASRERRSHPSSDELFERLPKEGSERINFDDGKQGTAFSSLLLDGTPPQVEIDESDIAILAYTSGTTGGAKGVLLSHGNLTADIEGCIKVMPITEQDAFLSIAPWHHILGLTVTLLIPMYTNSNAPHPHVHRGARHVHGRLPLNRSAHEE